MKSKVENSTRTLIIAACVFLAGALVLLPRPRCSRAATSLLSFSCSGGGGSSTSGQTNVAGTIGQAVLGFSAGGQFSLNAGFWQGSAAPCSVPTITLQPSSQTACEGGSASFSVTVNDPGVTYHGARTARTFRARRLPRTMNNVTASDALLMMSSFHSPAAPP